MKRMSYSAVFLGLIVLIGASAQAKSVNECITLHDSLTLCFEYRTGATKKAEALVVTLPMLGRDNSSYSRIVDTLAGEFPGLHFVNFDLRGHGKSTALGADTITFKSMDRAEFTKIPHDIKEALRLFRNGRKEFRKVPVIVIGASIGANSAGILANIDTRVKAAVLLSPGLDYRGLLPSPHLKMTDEDYLLFVVGKGDAYSYTSTDSLYKLAAGKTSLLVYNTSNHGTNIPNGSDSALGDIVDWMRKTLKAL